MICWSHCWVILCNAAAGKDQLTDTFCKLFSRRYICTTSCNNCSSMLSHPRQLTPYYEYFLSRTITRWKHQTWASNWIPEWLLEWMLILIYKNGNYSKGEMPPKLLLGPLALLWYSPPFLTGYSLLPATSGPSTNANVHVRWKASSTSFSLH